MPHIYLPPSLHHHAPTGNSKSLSCEGCSRRECIFIVRVGKNAKFSPDQLERAQNQYTSCPEASEDCILGTALAHLAISS